MRQINLGFPITFTDQWGNQRYGGWFWGQRHTKSTYSCWTDERYRQAESCGFKNVEIDDSWFFHPEECLSMFNTVGIGIRFNMGLYTDFIESEQQFLIPVDVKSFNYEEDLKYLTEVVLPEDVRRYVLAGKARVLFFSHEEGIVCRYHYSVFNRFCDNNGLDKQHVLVSSANLNLSELPLFDSRKFSIRVFNYFERENGFTQDILNEPEKRLERYLTGNRTEQKQYKLLCLNRRSDEHRAFLAGYLNSPEMKGMHLTSLGIGYLNIGIPLYEPFDGKQYVKYVENYASRCRHGKQALKFFELNSNRTVHHSPDTEANILVNRVDFNEDLYRKTFATVITETFFETGNVDIPRAFFSEKTFKPILALQPFVLVGLPNALSYLREQGYETFGKWWDESYDLETDKFRRMDLICDVIDYLSKKSPEQLKIITCDMEATLIHNYKNLIYGGEQRFKEHLDFLSGTV